jgi:nitrate/TMAO reductase-like tetraheme cytochrome c subunit
MACHADGFAGTPTDCVACHQDDYDRTTDPNHSDAGFPTDCRACHTTTAWEPASFDHNATAFPLTGQHRTLDCLACHSSGYTGTPTDCVACHQADYNGTTDPNHMASNFPTTCQNCHTSNGWSPSTWDHEPLFPIRSGAHSGISCTECHVAPTDYSNFECILCHEHNADDTNRDHNEVGGYEYLSSECYRCHPRGTH